MIWWIVGVSAFVLLQVVVRLPPVKAWSRRLYVRRRCPTCGAAIQVDASICPICQTTCKPLPVQTGRAELKRAHEDYVDSYVVDAGGRDALQARIVERARAAGLVWTTAQADAAIDVWRLQSMRPTGFEQAIDGLLGDANRMPWFAWVLPVAVASVFAWAGIGLACSRLGVGPFVDSGEAGSFRVTARGVAGEFELGASLVGAALLALAVTWLALKAQRKGWWDWE
jgi:endogenous inhibitor of DNA gyrase (YacG/DUF329 family)